MLFDLASPNVQEAVRDMFNNGKFTVPEAMTSGGKASTYTPISTVNSGFILTTNAGQQYIADRVRKGEPIDPDELEEALSRAGISGPLLNRIPYKLPTLPPTREEFKAVLSIHLHQALKQAIDRKELARLRLIEGWSIRRLEEHFGCSGTKLKKELMILGTCPLPPLT